MAAKEKEYLPLTGGFKIPVIGLGTWQSTDEAELENALNTALNIGYRHIDTAYVYENEAVIGRVLNEWLSSGKITREELFITTKLPTAGVHEERVEIFLKKSLENLQLDYVDLYLIHFPICTKYVEGEESPPPDKLETEPTDLKSVWKIEVHVYCQQRALVKFCKKNGIIVIAYCPLGSPGFNNFLEKLGHEPKKLPDLLNNETVMKIAHKYNKTSAQVLLRFLIDRHLAVIPKSVSPERIEENFNVFDFSLESEDLKTLVHLDLGEEGRICDFKIFAKFSEHPEWPFPREESSE